MTQHPESPELEGRRSRLYAELAAVGDFRPGSLSAVMRRCGRSNCACARPDHPGHGPQHILTRKVAGRTVALHLRPGPELERVRREAAAYKRFRAIVEQIVELSEALCEARPVSPLADGPAELTGVEKRWHVKGPPRHERKLLREQELEEVPDEHRRRS